MSEPLDIHRLASASSVSATRQGASVELIVLHSKPRPANLAIAAYIAPDAPKTPHYYIEASGKVYQFVPEERAARHSGYATWKQRRRNIDRISIGIALEHTPGSPFPPDLLAPLHELVAQLRARHNLTALDLALWEAEDQAEAWGQGTLIPTELPPVPLNLVFAQAEGLLGGAAEESDGAVFNCVPLDPPPPTTPILGGNNTAPVLGAAVDPALLERFWTFLVQETYRQRGGGFHSNWAFHRFALKNDLGAPLAPSSNQNNQVSVGGKSYGFQVFAHDTILNEIPQWTAVQRLSDLLGGNIPGSGLARQMLEASITATGSTLHAEWAFHQLVVRERLGPPLSGNYRMSVGGQEYTMQVFAADTLYSPVPRWSDVRRLSATPAGDLANALWVETYKPSGAAYQADTPFQRAAAEAKLGAPLTGVSQVDFEGIEYSMQVFALDTLYAGPDGAVSRLSGLPKPDYVTRFEPARPAQPDPSTQPDHGSPNDALSDQHPSFAMLPLAGQPRISQFYGFTKFSRQRTDIYRATQSRHSGLDFSAPEGTKLLAVGHGVVVCAGTGCPFGANRPGSIVVRYGGVYAVYGHARLALVRKGQLVRPGDVIGEVGNYMSPHLHFELRLVPAQVLGNRDPNQNPVNPGTAFNPIPFFASHLMPFFMEQLARLRGTVSDFCVGGLLDQPDITFGGPLDTRPCTN
jgi:murein DD-endopeptidase MepM/ murein hydrolase activator NlpD